MQITIPYPPTVNRMWRRVVMHGSPRTLLSKAGRIYRDDVAAAVLTQLGPVNGRALRDSRVLVEIDAWMPDRRRRDIDNLGKAVLDSLQAAGVFADDSQVDVLTIRRCGVVRGGSLDVRLEELP